MSDLFKRRGIFAIMDDILEDPEYRQALKSLFGKVIIVKAQHDYARKLMEYWAYSEEFNVIDDECSPRYYSIQVIDDGEVSFI